MTHSYHTTTPIHTDNLNPESFFLQLVAEDLLHKFGNDLSRTVVVFPNKRANLFFNDYLIPSNQKGGQPVWAPRYQTISELFRTLSPLSVADPIETICHIYNAYVALTHSQETLDFFYGWGERLLADFDDVDKNRADVSRLFRNLKEIKQLESNELFNEQQEITMQHFFQGFSLENNSRIRTKFLELWDQLLPIYQRVNAELAKEGLAYEGALYRKVLEQLENGSLKLPQEVDRYVFVGFNVLDKVEEGFFLLLQKQGKALFYWDYDLSYVEDDQHCEAGVFLRNNLKKFGNELPESYFNNMQHPKYIEFVSAPTENAQARAVGPWLEQFLTKEEKRTAVVLCNEELLQPVLYSLPCNLKQVNITKGFPLTHTPAYALFEKNMEDLQDKDYPKAELQLELLTAIQNRIKEAAEQQPQIDANWEKKPEAILYSEAYFQCYTLLNRFNRLIASGMLKVSLTTLHRLIRQAMKQVSIPFHGEPAVGLQVMGVLETRNLDFDNLLMLSVNEGTLPQKATDNSFIPYDLRTEFGLTTSRHKIAVYAYYFYRLIQRAKNLRLIYNCSSEGMVKGEMSRFMTQLLIKYPEKIHHIALTSKQEVTHSVMGNINKPQNLHKQIKRLSPSAINTYLRCQKQFFFRYVAQLKEPEPPRNVIEPNTFGSIFHKAAELIYKVKAPNSTQGRVITQDYLQQFLEKSSSEKLMDYIRQAFKEEEKDFNTIVAEVVKTYLQQLIRKDIQITPFEVVGTEIDKKIKVAIPYQGANVEIDIHGQIDRLDKVNIDGLTTLRVVDYKTGGKPEKAKELNELFTPGEKQQHYMLQTFIYAMTLGEQKFPIAPALFFVHQAAGDDYNPYLELNGEKVYDFYHTVEKDFKEKIIQLIAEIFDPEEPFKPTTVARFCDSCPFRLLCMS